MRKLVLSLALAFAGTFLGCSGSSSTSDAGSNNPVDAGADAGEEVSPTIEVSGSVSLNPVVAAAYDAGLLTGTPPAFAGQTLYIDEPLIATAQSVEAGRLATETLDGSGTYDVPQVPTDDIVIGLVGTIAGDSPDAGFAACDTSAGAPTFCTSWARSVTSIYENLKPTADVTNAPIFGVPVSYAELISQKLGLAAGNSLLDQGFVLGYVVQADGTPLSGVTFNRQGVSYNVQYLNDDLSPGGTATNASGMFLIVAPGQPNPSYKFSITGHPEFGCHRVGSSPGTVVSLIYDANRPGISCN